jgi:hypothetical protein
VAYWYGVQVLDAHLSCLDDLLKIVPKGTLQIDLLYNLFALLILVWRMADSIARLEIEFQYQLLTALQAILTAVFVVCLHTCLYWARFLIIIAVIHVSDHLTMEPHASNFLPTLQMGISTRL